MLYEIIVSSFMLALGIAGSIYTQSFRKPNAKWMPLVAFGIMIIFSLVVLTKSLVKYFKNRGKEKEGSPIPANQEGEGTVSWLDAHESLVSANPARPAEDGFETELVLLSAISLILFIV